MSEEKNEKSQTIIINQPENKRNGLGIAGFILALLGLFFSWIPVFGWIIWTVGLILSSIGVFKKPRGLAISGLVISIIVITLNLLIFGAIAAAVSGVSWSDILAI